MRLELPEAVRKMSRPARHFVRRTVEQVKREELSTAAPQRRSVELDVESLRRQIHATAREVLFLTALMSGAGDQTSEICGQIARLVRAVPDETFHSVLAERVWPDYVWLWVDLQHKTEGLLAAGDAVDPKQWEELKATVEHLVDRTWRKPWHSPGTFALELAAKNRRLALGVVAIAAIVGFVAPFRMTLLGRLTDTVVATALLTVVTAAVFVVTHGWRRSESFLRRFAVTGVFAWLRARRPEGFALDPSSARRVFELLQGLAIRCGAKVLAAIVIGVAWSLSGAPISAAWLVCIGFGVLVFLHSADYLAWLAPDPIREGAFLFVVVLVGVLLFDGRTVEEVLWLLGVGSLGFLFHAGWGARTLLAAENLELPAQGAWFVFKYLPPVAIVVTAFVVTLWTHRVHVDERWRGSDSPTLRIAETAWPRASDTEPIIAVAASGGGSRAAYYTARTFAMISRAGWDHNVELISSVSGGSLATAAYVWWRYEERDDPDDIVEFVSQDYVEPVLRGVFTPNESRGESIELAWSSTLGDEITIGALADRWNAGKPVPLPLFNTATLDGQGLVISPLPMSDYNTPLNAVAHDPARNQYAKHNTSEPMTWVYHRTGTYGLESFVPGFDPHLAEAVRASAAFPFGFPVVEVETQNRRFFSPVDYPTHNAPPKEVDVIGLTDGGVRSNSGLWPLFHILWNRADRLANRRVILVIVDASKMPDHKGVLTAHLTNQELISRNVHRRMLEALQEKLKGGFGVVQVDIPPLESHNAYTSWALDDASAERLKEDFDNGEAGWHRQISDLMAGNAVAPPSELPRIPLD